jgi:hypothetical protein
MSKHLASDPLSTRSMVLAVSETSLVPVRAHCTSPACCAPGQWDASIGCCTALVHTRYYGCARYSLCFRTWRTRAEETGGCFVMSRTTTTQAGSCHQGCEDGNFLVPSSRRFDVGLCLCRIPDYASHILACCCLSFLC